MFLVSMHLRCQLLGVGIFYGGWLQLFLLCWGLSSGMNDILAIVGTRPQIIKHGLLVAEGGLDIVCLHTGQHYDYEMSKAFFEEFKIPDPVCHINWQDYVTRSTRNHGNMVAGMLTGIEAYLVYHKYQAVLVYGDTNSTLAGALAAAKLFIPVIHVEAGVRLPKGAKITVEEINRKIVSSIASLHLCPTLRCVRNLDNGTFVGDLLKDGILKTKAKPPSWRKDLPEKFSLFTMHREENLDKAKKYLEYASEARSLVVVAHPRLKDIIVESDRVFIKLPSTYSEMKWLIQNAEIIFTDSGGINREAFFLNKRFVVMREEVEWTETLYRASMIARTPEDIPTIVSRSWLRLDEEEYQFGDGHAAQKIVSCVKRFLDSLK